MRRKMIVLVAMILSVAVILSGCGGVSKDVKEAIILETKARMDETVQMYRNGSTTFSNYIDIDDVSYEITDVQKNTNKYVVTIQYVCVTDSSLDSTQKDLACHDMEKLFRDYTFDYKGKSMDVTDMDPGTTKVRPCKMTSSWINDEEIHAIEKTEYTKAVTHKCTICGKTEGTRQITAQAGGKWDENWYCAEHYADAWQYYYGDK